MQVRARLFALLLAGCGGLAQPPECERYLACAEAVSPTSTRNSALTYGRGGTCWQNAADAQSCREVCKLAVQALQLGVGRSTPECQ